MSAPTRAPGVANVRLYVAGDGPNSSAARHNLRELLDEMGYEGASVEVVDCLLDPARVLADGIVLTPTLVVSQGGTRRVVVGDLSDRGKVVAALHWQGGEGARR